MSNPTIKQIQAPDGTVYDIEATKADTLTGLTSTVTELNYCDGVTSNIQTQLNNKQTKSNLVTSISASSTDSQYPSAKCVYDLLYEVETLLDEV